MGRIQAVREAISSDRNKCPIFSQQIKHIKSVIPTSSNRLARLAGGSIPKKPFSANFCPDSAVRTSPKTRLKRFFRLVIKTLKNRKRNRTLPKSMFLKTPKCQNAIMTVLQTMKTSRNVIGKEKNFGKHPLSFRKICLKIFPNCSANALWKKRHVQPQEIFAGLLNIRKTGNDDLQAVAKRYAFTVMHVRESLPFE
jgi:hypothetical protein